MGNSELVDSMINDGLWCAFDAVHMGAGTENYVGQVGGITREPQDELAAKTHERAAAAIKDGRFADEIVAGRDPAAQGRPDPRRHRRGRAARHHRRVARRLRPAFDKDGTITAGNASQISDGGAAVIVMSQGQGRGARRRRRSASSSATAWSPGPTRRCSRQPSRAIKRALEQGRHDGRPTSTCSSSTRRSPRSASRRWRDLGITDDVVNVNGGAIALGHPIGMSGNRLALTLLHELRRRGGGLGAAALCGGGGQGDALLVRTL